MSTISTSITREELITAIRTHEEAIEKAMEIVRTKNVELDNLRKRLNMLVCVDKLQDKDLFDPPTCEASVTESYLNSLYFVTSGDDEEEDVHGNVHCTETLYFDDEILYEGTVAGWHEEPSVKKTIDVVEAARLIQECNEHSLSFPDLVHAATNSRVSEIFYKLADCLSGKAPSTKTLNLGFGMAKPINLIGVKTVIISKNVHNYMMEGTIQSIELMKTIGFEVELKCV